MSQPIRVAMIGASQRAQGMYRTILEGLKGEIEVVGVWARREEPAQHLGRRLGAPAYTSLEKLAREQAPQIGIVSVSYGANGAVGLAAVEAGLNVLLETPIAHNLDEADRIIQAARDRGLKIEVAEQFHRRPSEQIKLKLIESGIFGRVYTAFNDFAGHGYHGVSVMRSYLGFQAQPLRVTGLVKSFELGAHWSRLADANGPRTETQEHGLIEFEDGRLGVFHWTDVGYDSPLRWWRSSRFLAEKGMGITTGWGAQTREELTLLAPGAEAPQWVALERRYQRVDGGPLEAIIAHTGDPELPIVRWDNPFAARRLQWHDDEIGVAGCLMSLVQAVRSNGAPSYGAHQARIDQEITLAIRQSAAEGGRPVEITGRVQGR